MKLRQILFSFVLSLVIFGSVFPVQKAFAESSGVTENPYWAHTAQDIIDMATKSTSSGKALNKEFGDMGSWNNQMVGVILAAAGGNCDSTTNSNCPQALDYRRSALAGLTNIAVATYTNPPASTYAFVQDIGKTLGFHHQVEAQGIGFAGLTALLPIWKGFRNIAYALLAVIMIVIGFMVMFRKKIDPKTVVTVQNAIPRIVVALLLVTFSYAIVGILIDLMYLSIILIISIISSATGDTLGKAVSFGMTFNMHVPSVSNPNPFSGTTASLTTPEVTSILLSGGVGKLLGFFFGSGWGAYNDLSSMLGNAVVGAVGQPAATVATYAGSIFGFLVGGPKGALYGTLLNGPVLLGVILIIVLIFGFIRLVFMLLDAYINILIALLTAPFQLMMEAIPGTNSFNSWFRNILSKLLTFPITIALLLVSAILTSQTNASSIWAPPLLSSGGGVYGMAGFIGLGMLLIIPNVVGGLQKAMKAEPMIPGGVGAVVGPLGQGVGQLMQLGYQGSFIASAVRHKPDAREPLQVAREGAAKGFGSITGGGGGSGH